MHQRRRINKTQNPVGKGHGLKQRGLIVNLRVDSQIPYTLSRQGQVFGVRRDHYAVPVDLKDAWNLMAIIDDFPVRFVGNHIDGGLVFLLGSRKYPAKFGKRFPGINLSGRVIGAVNDDCLGVWLDCRFNGCMVQIKIRIRLNNC